MTDRVLHASMQLASMQLATMLLKSYRGAMALVSICVQPNHATFMTDTLDATFVTSILFVCANSNVCPGSTMHFMCLKVSSVA